MKRARIVLAVAVLAATFAPARGEHSYICEGLITQKTNPVLSGGSYPVLFRTDGQCRSWAFDYQGYMARGEWTIRIVRDKKVFTYTQATNPQCRRTLILPDDSVTITVSSGWMYVFYDDDIDDCPI